MTENNRNASDRGLRYKSPRVKVVEVMTQGILCLSGWNNGSDSDGGDMEGD